jgi:hypothetical protein
MAVVSAEVGFDARAAAAGVVFLNGLLGRVCFGAFDGVEPTYAALDGWLGRPVEISPDPNHVEVARRYLRGYGLATPRDLATWWGSGLTESQAAWAALGDELLELRVEGRPVWLLKADSTALERAATPGRMVRLLPAFDTYLLGYAGREWAVPKAYQKRIFHGGQVAPTVLVDGCAAGTWHYEQRGRQMRITVTPFEKFSAEVRERLAEEAGEVGRFYGVKTQNSFA